MLKKNSYVDESRQVSVVVMTLGTFDLLHVGHVRIIQRAAEHGTRLVVGVASDAYNIRKKQRNPVYPQDQRMEMVSALRWVDHVFSEEGFQFIGDYIDKYSVDVIVMGDDKVGEFERFVQSHGVKIVYLPRTENISSTETLERIVADFSITTKEHV